MRCVVSHDAGGAEILASYVSRNPGNWCFALEGPAVGVFERRLGKCECLALGDAIYASESVLTGSSWASDLEWQAIAMARELRRPVVTFIDHWVNYRERFIRHRETHLPDEIWVGDVYAFENAKALFPDTPVACVANPYLEDIRDEMARRGWGGAPSGGGAAGAGLKVLFVAEPISEHALRAHGDARHWGYTEFDALDYLSCKRACLGQSISMLTIRPHPSEATGKYALFARNWDGECQIGGAVPLLEEIAAADIVVGCASMAMVVALAVGKKVVCAIPPGGGACPLPHREILPLNALVEA